MHSGDAGYFNVDRQLVVIDRIKDLAETSRGERFSPQIWKTSWKFRPISPRRWCSAPAATRWRR